MKEDTKELPFAVEEACILTLSLKEAINLMEGNINKIYRKFTIRNNSQWIYMNIKLVLKNIF